MRNLRLFTVLRNSGNKMNQKLSADDVKNVINDITDAGITFTGKHAMVESARVCSKLLKDILKRLHKKQLQDVTYAEIPMIITELNGFMALQNKKHEGVY